MPKTKRRVGRPTREDADALADRIVEVATQCFVKAGYSATVQDIAAGAGVGKRTIYARYPAKEILFAAVLERLRLRRAASTPQLDAGLPLFEALRLIAAFMFRASVQPEALALHRLLLREGHKFPELAHLMVDAVYQEYGAPLAAYLRAQIGRGGVRAVDPDKVAALFVNLIAGEMNRRVLLLAEPGDSDAFAAAAVDIFIHGLLPVIGVRADAEAVRALIEAR